MDKVIIFCTPGRLGLSYWIARDVDGKIVGETSFAIGLLTDELRKQGRKYVFASEILQGDGK